MLTIIKALYFIIPAYLANMAPVVAARIPVLARLNFPLDGNRTLRGKPILGKNKTWLGVAAAVCGGLVAAYVQHLLYRQTLFAGISLIDYSNWLAFGSLAGLGSILGDALKSFFKRRLGITAGGAWPVFDQLDFIFGFFVFTYYLTRPDWTIILAVAVLTLILHPLTNIASYLLGIKKVWW